MKNKFAAVALAGLLALGTVACGGGEGTDGGTDPGAGVTEPLVPTEAGS